MSQRRWIILIAVVAVLLAGAEIALRQWVAPKACVQVINQGSRVMDDLIISYADTQVALGRLAVGQSTQVWLTAGPKGPLRLDFGQKGNALSGFQVTDFDPQQNARDRFKLVLIIKTNEIQRFMDDDESRKKLDSLGDRIREWLHSEIGLPR